MFITCESVVLLTSIKASSIKKEKKKKKPSFISMRSDFSPDKIF